MAPRKNPSRRRPKKKSTRNGRGPFELFYSTGGHGGPYASDREATDAAVRTIKGNRNERWVKIVPRSEPWEKTPRSALHTLSGTTIHRSEVLGMHANAKSQDAADMHIANPGGADFFGLTPRTEGPLFEMWFGAYSSTRVYVWADSLDIAFEIAVEWLDDEGLCGHFVTLDDGDIRSVADELGYDPDVIFSAMKDGDWTDEVNEVMQAAEADLTIIGHTTLRNCKAQLGSGPLYVPSWEWGGRDVSDKTEFAAVHAESVRREDEDEDEGCPECTRSFGPHYTGPCDH